VRIRAARDLGDIGAAVADMPSLEARFGGWQGEAFPAASASA